VSSSEQRMTGTTGTALVRRLRAAGCVYAEREAELIEATFPTADARESATARRERGDPLEHILGAAEFGGVSVTIGAGCFVPRARAVALVEAAEQLVTQSDAVALDLGCGCGPIASALAHRRPGWRVLATDVDETVLVWARRNAQTFGFSVSCGSWFTGLPAALRGGLDVVVAHLPYVPTAEISLLPRDFRDHEPRRSVDGGQDGLDPLREVAPEAGGWLAPDGVLLTQVTHAQHPVAVAIAERAGLSAGVVEAPPLGAADPADPDDLDDLDDLDDVDAETIVLALRPAEADR
jgi:release factor glutamine methyltransferase